MKKAANILLALFTLAIVIAGCKKSEMKPSVKGSSKRLSLKLDSALKLTVSQPVTTKNTADTLTITGLSQTDSVKWFITPAVHSNIIQKSNSRLVASFDTSGTFVVKAVINNNDTLSASVKVDTLGSGSPQSVIPFQAGDQLVITPSFYKGASPDSTGILFRAHTTDIYNCLNSVIHASWSDYGNSFSINYMDVVQPNGNLCWVGSRVLSLNSFFQQNPASPYLVNGTYPLTIVFGSATYKGKIIISDKTIKFDWNYTSGVTFTTKQISY